VRDLSGGADEHGWLIVKDEPAYWGPGHAEAWIAFRDTSRLNQNWRAAMRYTAKISDARRTPHELDPIKGFLVQHPNISSSKAAEKLQVSVDLVEQCRKALRDERPEQEETPKQDAPYLQLLNALQIGKLKAIGDGGRELCPDEWAHATGKNWPRVKFRRREVQRLWPAKKHRVLVIADQTAARNLVLRLVKANKDTSLNDCLDEIQLEHIHVSTRSLGRILQEIRISLGHPKNARPGPKPEKKNSSQ
jgi:hypothetical protein